MADASDKEKAEKLAAAKKRFEQLKKEKEAAAGKGDATASKKKKKKPTKADASGAGGAGGDGDGKALEKPDVRTNQEEGQAPSASITDAQLADGAPTASGDQTEPLQDAIDADDVGAGEDEEEKDKVTDPDRGTTAAKHGRQPSLSIQSRMRSESFRKAAATAPSIGSPLSPGSAAKTDAQPLPALTPDGDSINEIYRKQTLRVEELERENRQLVKDADATASRQRRMDEELEELREKNVQFAELKFKAEKLAAKDDELVKLKSEISSLQRQNAHLQSNAQKNMRKDTTSPSASSASPQADLMAQLDSKSVTMESMEQEISDLRAQLDKSANSATSHAEQVAALEGRVARAESAAGKAQRELADARKSLERASEKAVKEGSERTSAQTQIAELERTALEKGTAAEDAARRAETAEKKLAALTNLHKDAEARRAAGENERERMGKEALEARRRVERLESENARLKDERNKSRLRDGAGATDDDGLDELEDEQRGRLEARIRDLETELFEARRGVWRERRRELQEQAGSGADDVAAVSPGGGFDEVDLFGSGGGGSRRGSSRGGAAQQQNQRRSSFRTVLASGINAFTGGSGQEAGHRGSLDLLEDDDDAFDEDAFRAAAEEDSKRRLERVKELKRGLKQWESWRVDLVDLRGAGGGGIGEIFEV